MNFILALVIFILIGLLQGYPVDKPVIGELTEDGAARQAGLQQGDVVMSINGQPMSSWTDVVTIIRKAQKTASISSKSQRSNH